MDTIVYSILLYDYDERNRPVHSYYMNFKSLNDFKNRFIKYPKEFLDQLIGVKVDYKTNKLLDSFKLSNLFYTNNTYKYYLINKNDNTRTEFSTLKEIMDLLTNPP